MQAIYAELARIETIVGKNTPLRAYFRNNDRAITITDPPNKKFGANGMNPLQNDLFFYSFNHGVKEFYQNCLEPTLQQFSRNDPACLSYLHIAKPLRMNRFMIALMTERVLSDGAMFEEFLKHIEPSGRAFLEALIRDPQPLFVHEILKSVGAQDAPSVISLCQFSATKADEHDGINGYKARLPDEVRKTLAARLNININPAGESTPAKPQETMQTSATMCVVTEKILVIATTKDTPTTHFSYNVEDFILQKADKILKYVALGEIELTKADKPTKKSLRDLTTICGITEFFPMQYADFDILAAQTIWRVLETATSSRFAPADDSTLGLVKFWVNELAKQPFSLRKTFLPDYRVALSPRENLIVPHYLAFLRATPPEGYISVESLRDYAHARRSVFSLVAGSNEPWREFKMLATPQYRQSRYERFMPMPATQYFDAVTMPILKGLSFMLAAIGVLEIFYDEPFGSPVRHGLLSYITPFDGLRYFRLTPLGRYALGLDKENAGELAARAEASKTKTNHIVTFDDKRLMLWIHCDDIERQSAARKFLEPYWRDRPSSATDDKIIAAPGVERLPYWTNFALFTKDCASEKQAVQKIQSFIRELDFPYDDMPSVWESFVRKIVNSSKAPIAPESGVKVFKVDKNSAQARALVADPVIAKLIIKAEGYRILVKEDRLKDFQNRLRELGLFLS
jgi:hypothetical protein